MNREPFKTIDQQNQQRLRVVNETTPQISNRSVISLVLYISGWVIGLIWAGVNYTEFFPFVLGFCLIVTGILAGFE